MSASGPLWTPKQTDSDDVSTALSTAEALLGRGERAEALKWVRRAAEKASDAEDDDRALELAKVAAELATTLSPAPAAVSSPPPASARLQTTPGLAAPAPPAAPPPAPAAAAAPPPPPAAAVVAPPPPPAHHAPPPPPTAPRGEELPPRLSPWDPQDGVETSAPNDAELEKILHGKPEKQAAPPPPPAVAVEKPAEKPAPPPPAVEKPAPPPPPPADKAVAPAEKPAPPPPPAAVEKPVAPPPPPVAQAARPEPSQVRTSVPPGVAPGTFPVSSQAVRVVVTPNGDGTATIAGLAAGASVPAGSHGAILVALSPDVNLGAMFQKPAR